jgi:dolichol-phosphate mannosyltransferase
MEGQPRALIVIPTYNEAENLQALLSEIMALPVAFDVLVVDDNSPDGTGEIADRLAAASDQIHVMHRAGKQGLGTAYIAGFAWALERDYAYILQMDCDFSHHPRYLPTFMEKIKDADLVIGSRYVAGGGTVNWGILRKIISAGGNAFARFMLGLKVHDCTGGFRCYRRGLIEAIPWGSIALEGYGFLIGVLYNVTNLGARIAEFPIIFEDRRVGQSKMSKAIIAEALLWVLRTSFQRPRHRLAAPSPTVR